MPKYACVPCVYDIKKRNELNWNRNWNEMYGWLNKSLSSTSCRLIYWNLCRLLALLLVKRTWKAWNPSSHTCKRNANKRDTHRITTRKCAWEWWSCFVSILLSLSFVWNVKIAVHRARICPIRIVYYLLNMQLVISLFWIWFCIWVCVWDCFCCYEALKMNQSK